MKPSFMLDTDSVCFALRGHGQVAARIVERRPSEICISAVTLAELRYGASRRNSPTLHELIDAFTANVAEMPFDESCAFHFGRIASDLAERGVPIGEYDALIASHAITLEVALVTNDVGHFERVAGLAVESWL